MQETTNAPYIAALEIVEGCYLPAYMKAALVIAVNDASRGHDSDFHEVRTLANRYGTPREATMTKTRLNRGTTGAANTTRELKK